MATGRTQVGLRRGGPRLRSLLALPLLFVAGCFGLDEEEEARLSMFQQNSQDFYQRGAYAKALHQADMALTMDGDLVGMRLIRGFCLTKLGQSLANQAMIDDAVTIFDGLTAEDPGDFRTWLGSGQAHLARSIGHEQEMGRIGRRLDSDFLDEQGRKEEEQWLERETRAREADLLSAERSLLRVLDDELQHDNVYALIDLVLVLTSLEGRDDDALARAQHAVSLLDQQITLTENTLQKNVNLPPDGKLSLERRVDDSLAKQQLLLGIIISIEFTRGAYQACLESYEMLEEKQLMGVNEYFNRAALYEELGMYSQAIDDLEAYMRLRARLREYDEVASLVFDRIEELRSREARDAQR